MFEEAVVNVYAPTWNELLQAATLFVPSVGPQYAHTSKYELLPASVACSVAEVAVTDVALLFAMPMATATGGVYVVNP